MQRIKGKTGVVYDAKMMEHQCLWGPHPECPERFSRIIERCAELGLLERCNRLKSRSATIEEVSSIHQMDHYNFLKSTSTIMDETELEDISSRFNSIYLHPSTFELALLSAGCVIELVEQILDGNIHNGMAIVRPPGHHAMSNEINGFCYLNNVAIAAQLALKRENIQKILIVDWDIHHGQGTQRLFYDDPRVLYFSIHRFEHGEFWPHLQESDYDSIGTGCGKGFNFNVPINKLGAKNGDYLAIFQQILVPVAMEFQPDLVLVSAGYDSALGCPLGGMSITPACYAHLLHPLLGVANGKVAVVLEGGYFLDSLAEGAAITLKTLLGDPCPQLVECLEPPSEIIQTSILNCIYSLQPYWKCFKMFNDDGRSSTFERHTVTKFFNGPIENVLLLYPTRYAFPAHSENSRKEVLCHLNKLKFLTNLNVPRNKVGYVNSSYEPELKYWLDKNELLNRLHVIEYSNNVKFDDLHLGHPKDEFEKFNQYKIGSLIELVDSVCSGQSQNGIAITSHQTSFEDNFNNIKIVTQYAIQKKGAKRILLVDWCGTLNLVKQQSYGSSSDILRILLYYPDNDESEITSNDFNIKIPLNKNYANTMDYMAVFHRIIMPIAYEYNPDLVITSITFDNSNNARPEVISFFVHWLSALANGRIILNIQGYESLKKNSNAIIQCARILFGDPILPILSDSNDTMHCLNAIENVLRMHENFWKSLKFNKILPIYDVEDISKGIEQI